MTTQSDHRDHCSAASVDGKARVRTLDDYMSLEVVSDADFFCRFQYNRRVRATGPHSRG